VQIARFVGNAFIAHSLGVELGTLPDHRGDVGLIGLRPGRPWSENSAGGRWRAEDLSSLADSIPAQEKGPGELGELRGEDQELLMKFVLFWLKAISQQSGAWLGGV
jgi:hypothetical protein